MWYGSYCLAVFLACVWEIGWLDSGVWIVAIVDWWTVCGGVLLVLGFRLLDLCRVCVLCFGLLIDFWSLVLWCLGLVFCLCLGSALVCLFGCGYLWCGSW